jgi:uncharacterized membrane protein YGL010W
MMMILDFPDSNQAVIFSLKEIVVLIVNDIVDGACILGILWLLCWIVKGVSTILISLILHEGLGKELFVVCLYLADQLSYFSLEFESD